MNGKFQADTMLSIPLTSFYTAHRPLIYSAINRDGGWVSSYLYPSPTRGWAQFKAQKMTSPSVHVIAVKFVVMQFQTQSQRQRRTGWKCHRKSKKVSVWNCFRTSDSAEVRADALIWLILPKDNVWKILKPSRNCINITTWFAIYVNISKVKIDPA